MEHFVVNNIFWNRYGATTYNYENLNGWKLKKVDEIGFSNLTVDHATVGKGCDYGDNTIPSSIVSNQRQHSQSYGVSSLTTGGFGNNLRTIRIMSGHPNANPILPPGGTPDPTLSDMKSEHWVRDNGAIFGIGEVIF